MRLTSALALAMLATTVTAVPALAQDHRGPGTISIEGHGEVTASPDTAYVTSGAAMTELIAALKTAGIEDRDIQTSGFSVQPNYVYTDARDANGYTLPPKIVGYQVYNTVNVRVRALDALGAVLDKAVTVGANTINGVSFAVADPSKLYDEARKLAFGDALAKARLYTDAARIELESIRSITEVSNYNQPPQPYMMKEVALQAAGDSAVPVQTGELTFAINVQVTWELDN